MRLPRTQKALNRILSATAESNYAQGFRAGTQQGKIEEQAALKHIRDSLHQEALKKITDLVSTVGQAISVVVRGMASEKGQL